MMMQRLLTWLWTHYRDTSLIVKMTAGFVLGLGTALIFGDQASWLAPLGDIFLRLLQWVVIPIIMLTLIEAMNQAQSGSVVRIAFKVFGYYILTTMVAMLIGLGLALMVNPGNGLQRPEHSIDKPDAPSIVHTLVHVVPDNLFQALVDGNILSLIFMALVLGIVIAGMRRASDAQVQAHGQQLFKLTLAGREATFRILSGVLQYAPIGVFGLVADKIGNQGGEAVLALGKLTGVIYAGLLLQVVLIYSPLLLLYRVPIRMFFRNSRDALATAFTTQSSSGTIPLSMTAARRSGLLDEVAGFVIPLGATVNMDGAVIRYGASVVLAANIVGYQLGIPEMAGLVLTATAVSIGTAGVPGAGLIGLTILLSQAGLPLDIVGLVAGIDVILGMGATMINVTGDLVGAHIIDRSERRAQQRQSRP